MKLLGAHVEAVINLEEAEAGVIKDFGTSVLFNSKHVEPGEVIGLNAAIKGQRFRLLDESDENYIVVPLTLAMQWSAADLIALSKDYLDNHYAVTRQIRILSSYLKLRAEAHSVPGFVTTPEQRDLIEGTDMATKAEAAPKAASSGINRHRSHWRVMGNGKLAYIKGSEAKAGWTDNHKEALAYNLARAMGIGKYFATTSLFRHPSTKRFMSVIEAIPYGRHYRSRPPDAWLSLGYTDPGIKADEQVLKDLGDSGELDKLALYDQIIVNTDRHSYNWMISHATEPKFKLIDHGLAFDSSYPVAEPSYWSTYHSEFGPKNARGYNDYKALKLHPEAKKWLDGQNVDLLRAEMVSMGVPIGVIDSTLVRLQGMKDISKDKGDNLKKDDAFNNFRASK